MNSRLASLVLLSLAALSACAGINVRHVAADDTTTEGLRYCRPAPYLRVTRTVTMVPELKEPQPGANPGNALIVTRAAADSTEYEYEVVMLPDPSQTYAIDWSTGLFGNVAPDITLEDGWKLVALKGEIDSGLADGLGAVKDLVSAASARAEGRSVPADATVKQDVFLVPLKLDTSDPKKPTWTIGTAAGIKP